jgi:hypothetical protein
MAAFALIFALAALAGAAREDDLAAVRARVESLYGSGSLPEALATARQGLRTHADDPILLRRACQLAVTLRAPELARGPADRLAQIVREGKGIEPSAFAVWKSESDALAREVADLEARELAVAAATVRARAVALVSIAMLGVGLVALAKRSRPLP